MLPTLQQFGNNRNFVIIAFNRTISRQIASIWKSSVCMLHVACGLKKVNLLITLLRNAESDYSNANFVMNLSLTAK